MSDAMSELPTIGVEVATVPDAALIRPAVEAVLAGRPFSEGPEAAIGRAVADAVRAAQPPARGRAGGEPSC